MTVQIPITNISRAIIVAKFKRKLEAAKCSSGGHLCPKHILRIFEEVLDEHTLNVDKVTNPITNEEPPKED